jgi:hypothetical protein
VVNATLVSFFLVFVAAAAAMMAHSFRVVRCPG